MSDDVTKKKIKVNMVSESDIGIKGHGVHTAYLEMAKSLERRDDVELIRGGFGQSIDCDVIHLHTLGSEAWKKLFKKGPAKVVSAHIIPSSLIGSIVLAKYWAFFAKFYMRIFYNRADKVLAVSKTVGDVLNRDLGIPKEKIEVFYNTIDMKQYDFSLLDKKEARKKLGIGLNDFVVLGNGQIQPRKRIDVFLKMAKELHDVKFIWVGGIPFKRLGASYSHMKKLGGFVPDNMIMTGLISLDEVKNYLAASDVFCLPAEQENHPMCVLEAAGAGLPIILRDIPEYDDTFKDDVIRCSDDDFAFAVKRLKEDNNFYQAQKQKTQSIAERFDSNKSAERLVNLYRQLI